MPAIDVLCITPPLSAEERYGKLSGAGSSAPSLGILMLAAVCRQSGYTTAVLDASARFLGMDETVQETVRLSPRLICISSTTLSISSAADYASRCKQLMPGVVMAVGGPHASAVPRETLQRFPAFDIAAPGEGEDTVRELAGAVLSGTGYRQVAGIMYREHDGEIRDNGPRPFIRQLDQLPLPAWDLLGGFPREYAPAPFKVRSLPSASLVTSRGCPNQCIFCDRSVFGTSCHAFSAGYVLDMMLELYQRYGVRHICFEDDTFVTFKSRLVEICNRLIELKLDLTWSCLGRVNHVTAENLSLMKRAGCWQISFGIESGSDAILAAIRKNTTVDKIRQAVAMTHQAGIMSKGFFIVGHPGETRETLQMTEAFALELPLDDISVTMLTPFPGTEIYDRAEEFGSFDRDWQTLNLLNAVFVPHGLTRGELEAAQQRILKRFYYRPRIIANYCCRLLANPSTIPAVARGFVSFVRSMG